MPVWSSSLLQPAGNLIGEGSREICGGNLLRAARESLRRPVC
jgi:hypothetical protein